MECCIARGLACGATLLDERFEAMLRQKLGQYAESILTVRETQLVKESFVHHIKDTFNPYDKDCEHTYEIAIPDALDIPSVDLERGYLMLTRSLSQLNVLNLKKRY